VSVLRRAWLTELSPARFKESWRD